MQNKIEDLRNHLFAQLERLGNEDLTPEELNIEVERSEAIKGIASVLVLSAKVEVDFIKATEKTDKSEFFGYTNKRLIGE